MKNFYKSCLVLVYIFFLLSINILKAQTYKWGTVNMGGGGFVSGIITSKTQQNLMYARTDVGGAYRWNSTTSSWVSLLDWCSENQKGYQGVESIALDPSASNIVYMLVGTDYFNGGATAVIRSTDYGNSFTISDVTSQFKAHGNGMGRQNGERLAVDPNLGSVLFCGSRRNGLFKSVNSGTTWTNVSTIGNATANGNGINFVIFDPSTGTTGNATQTIVFGISQLGSVSGTNLYISNNGGTTFTPITGAPANLMPQRAVLNTNRELIITYASAEGPWNIGRGQIWKYSLTTGTWTNLTPAGYTFGFGGISVDPNNSNRMIASSMNVYWNQYGSVYGDRFFLTTNGGTNWTDIVAGGITINNNGMNWINGGSIHWTGSIEFNPFNTNQAHVVSGNGIFTNDNVNSSKVWKFNVKDLEETVPIDVISIPNGPLISVLLDYDGFVHSDITQFPPNRHNPSMGSTYGIAYAGSNTNNVVRVASSIYYSNDQGSTWTKTANMNGVNGRIGISANGATFLHCPSNSTVTYKSTDNGTTWIASNGLTINNAIPVGDPVNSNKFYAYDNASGNLFLSVDGGSNFSAAGNAGTGGSRIIRTAPGYEGHLWVALYGGGLTRSTNSGTSFTKLPGVTNCQAVGLGKAAPGSPYYSIYIWGVVGGVTGVYRSDNQGSNWVRINDDDHEYGGVGNGGYVIGDFNVYGRVYLSTVGRGIPYGEISVNSTCNSLSMSGSVMGNASLCDGSTATYSISGVASATGYSWSVPNGATILTGANTNAISVKFGSISGFVSVRAFNSCSTVSSSSFSVTVNALPVITPYLQIDYGAWNLLATATICSGSTVAFGPWPNVTAGWAYAGPNGYTSTQRNPTITNLATTQAGVYTATYTDPNGCKDTQAFSISINSIPTAPVVSPNLSYCLNASSVNLSAAGTNLLWYTLSTGGIGNSIVPKPITTIVGLTNYFVSQTVNGCESPLSRIAVNVNPLNSTALSIISSATTVCSGTGVTFTATGTNAGTAPVFTWFRNNVSQGTGSTFTYIPSNGDVIRAIATVGGTLPTCLTGSTATSNGINLTVNPIQTTSVSIVSSTTNVCSGTGVTFTATGVNAGTVPIFTWFRNNISQGTGRIFSYSPSNGDVIRAIATAGGTLPTCLTGSPATSNGINLTVNPIPTPNVSITSSATTVCSGTGITFTATGTNAGTTPSYAWFRNNTQIGTGTTISITPANGDQISARLTAGGTLPACLSPTTNVSNVINLTVNPIQVPNVTINSSATTVCSGAGITFTATGTNAGTTPSYAWFRNNSQIGTGTTISITPANGDQISARLTAGGTLPACLSPTTDVSNVINLTVNPIQVPNVTITSSATTVCSGTGITFTATGTNAGTIPSYVWFRNNSQIGTGATISITPANGDQISARLTAGGTIPACLSPSTNVSNVINLTVNPIQVPNVTITSSATTVCSGTGITFTATGTNAGTIPSYAWFRNNSQIGTGTTITITPANGDQITARLTAGGTLPACLSPSTAASNAVSLTVNSVLVPSVAITSSATTICSGSGITFTATGTNTSTSPTYTWFRNNTPIGTGTTISLTPNNGDLIKAVLTTSGTCISTNPATSNEVQLTVSPRVQPTVSISASANPTCSNTGVSYTAYPTNGGTNPSYVWTVNGSTQPGNGPTFNYTPSHNDRIIVRLTVGGTQNSCLANTTATSNAITAQVTGTIATGISVMVNSTTVCQGNMAMFTATASGTGTTPIYAWFVNGNKQNTATNTFSYSPNAGDQVIATMTPGGNGTTCILGGTATSNGITLTVQPNQTGTAMIQTDRTTICNGETVTLSATSTNLGTSPTYIWYVNGQVQSQGIIYSYSPMDNDMVTAIAQAGGSIPNCLTNATATSNGINLQVNNFQQVSVTITSSATQACSGTGVTFTATGINGGSAPTYTWWVNNEAKTTGNIFTYNPSDRDLVKASIVIGGTLPRCLSNTSAISNGIDITVDPCLKPQVSSITGPAFVATSSSNITYSVPNVPGDSYQWTVPAGANITSGQGTNSITVDFGNSGQGQITLTQTNANGSTQVQQTVTIGTAPAITTIDGPMTVTEGSTGITYSITSVPGTSYQWTVPNGATIISGQGTNSITVDFGTSVSGVIALAATNVFGTSTTNLSVQTAPVTGMNEESKALKIELFPNPSEKGFTIQAPEGEVRVMDIHGVAIQKWHHQSASTFGESYPAGVYLIQWENSSGVIKTGRLVKLR